MVSISNNDDVGELIHLALNNGDNRQKQRFITKMRLYGMVRQNVDIEVSNIFTNFWGTFKCQI